MLWSLELRRAFCAVGFVTLLTKAVMSASSISNWARLGATEVRTSCKRGVNVPSLPLRLMSLACSVMMLPAVWPTATMALAAVSVKTGGPCLRFVRASGGGFGFETFEAGGR